jgi:hypothetical protein
MPRRSLLGIMGVSILLGSEQRAVAKDTAKNAAKPVFVEEVSFPASLPSSFPASSHPSAFSLPPSISFSLCLLFSRSLGFNIDLAPSLLSLLARSLARLHAHSLSLARALSLALVLSLYLSLLLYLYFFYFFTHTHTHTHSAFYPSHPLPTYHQFMNHILIHNLSFLP